MSDSTGAKGSHESHRPLREADGDKALPAGSKPSTSPSASLSGACDHCDGAGEVLEPGRTPEEPSRMISCSNCQAGGSGAWVIQSTVPKCAVCGALITGHHDCVQPISRTSVQCLEDAMVEVENAR